MAAMRCGAKMILLTGAAAFLWTEHASAGFSIKLGYHGHLVLCAVFRAAKKMRDSGGPQCVHAAPCHELACNRLSGSTPVIRKT